MQPTPNPGQSPYRLPPHRVQPLPGRHAYHVHMEAEAEPHIVNRLPAMVGLIYASCTCTEKDDADCLHTRAVEAYLEERRRHAAWRRNRGLTYSGVRLAIVPDLEAGSWMTEPYVEVWEGETSQVLEAGSSQELFNHSPGGFEWGVRCDN